MVAAFQPAFEQSSKATTDADIEAIKKLDRTAMADSDNLWYSNKLLRIYHPNMRNWEVYGFDVAKFVEDCASVNAEAIVVNAGGIYSYYPSRIKHHKPNPRLGGRDLFGEICKEAKKKDLKIIARFDFAGAATELSELYPGWFHTNIMVLSNHTKE